MKPPGTTRNMPQVQNQQAGERTEHDYAHGRDALHPVAVMLRRAFEGAVEKPEEAAQHLVDAALEHIRLRVLGA
jgi:hypothetical protein